MTEMTPNTSWAELKSRGNAAFSAGNFVESDDLYAEALLELIKEKKSASSATDFATLHANRSASLLKQGRAAAALEEAENAVNKTPKWSKAHFRKGEALKALTRWKEACVSMTEAARLAPQETSLKTQIQTLRARAQEQEDKPAQQRLQEHVQATGSIANLPVTPAYSQFSILAELGEGNYSQVFQASFAPTKEVFALKVIDKTKAERLSMRHGNLKSELRAERRILSKLHHPNVVRLFATFQDVKNIYYIEEFCGGRELWFRLRVVPPVCLKKEWPVDSKLWGLCGLKQSECRFYLAQIVNALGYLRRQGIVHRDLKPENVMIAESPHSDDQDPRYARVKLIDFGTARDLLDAYDDTVADEDKKDDDENENDEDPKSGGAALGRKRKQSHFVGTAEFMSPEAVHGRPADHRSDLWSFGCTAFQLFTGRTPFKGASDYLTFLKADAAAYSLPTYFGRQSPEQALLERLLKVDPTQRLERAEDLKAMAYFEGVDFAALEDPAKPPRIPIPTLTEMCVERVGTAIWIEAEAVGEGPLSRKTSSSSSTVKRKVFDGDETRQEMNLSQLHSRLDDATKTLVRGWLEQRSVLSCATTFRILYGGGDQQDRTRGDSRIANHAFLGYSQQEEGHYSEPFIVAVIDDPGQEKEHQQQQQHTAILNKLNESTPPPRIVFVHSSCSSKGLDYLNVLKRDIPIARIPSCDDGNKNDDDDDRVTYYSFWLGGVLFIVLDCARFNEDQALWFDRELLVGKLCARYCIVISQKRWFYKSHATTEEALLPLDDEEEMFPLQHRQRFLRDMQESGVQLIVRIGSSEKSLGGAGTRYTVTKSTPNEPNMTQVETPMYPEKIRIIRLLPTDAVSDPYSADELTGYFHLEKGELLSDGEVGGHARGDARSRNIHGDDDSSDDE